VRDLEAVRGGVLDLEPFVVLLLQPGVEQVLVPY